jgi:hypothetical protein
MKSARTGDAPLCGSRPNEWAWCGERRLPLMPKAFAVLRQLVDHAGRLITKADLLESVWRGTAVSEAALTSCIRDLRKALGDSPTAPRYIETVHRRDSGSSGRSLLRIRPCSRQSPAMGKAERSAPPAPPMLVGREAELGRLRELLEEAMNRRRQLVFVTGEPGIGRRRWSKLFSRRSERSNTCASGRGQCVEQYGAGEAYLPVLERSEALGRETRGGRDRCRFQAACADMLAQLPAILHDEDLEAVQRRAQGARATGCCASWSKPSTSSPWLRPSSSSSKTCTGERLVHDRPARHATHAGASITLAGARNVSTGRRGRQRSPR